MVNRSEVPSKPEKIEAPCWLQAKQALKLRASDQLLFAYSTKSLTFFRTFFSCPLFQLYFCPIHLIKASGPPAR